MGMKYTRIYTGSDGKSHFEDVKVPLQDAGSGNLISGPVKAKEIIFRETSGDYYLDWHNAPRRQFIITLDGKVEIEIGDGTSRQFGPGDILLAEDATGQGHISRAVNNQPRTSIIVILD